MPYFQLRSNDRSFYLQPCVTLTFQCDMRCYGRKSTWTASMRNFHSASCIFWLHACRELCLVALDLAALLDSISVYIGPPPIEREKGKRNDRLEKKNTNHHHWHLLKAQKALALLLSKSVGHPGIESYPAPSHHPTTPCLLRANATLTLMAPKLKKTLNRHTVHNDRLHLELNCVPSCLWIVNIRLADKSFSTFQNLLWPWKLNQGHHNLTIFFFQKISTFEILRCWIRGQGHQNLIYYVPCPSEYLYWVKSICLFRGYGIHTRHVSKF